jgi:hypothetical protein
MGHVRCRDGGNWDGLDRLAQRSPSLSHGLLDPQFWTKKSSNIDTRSIIVVERGGAYNVPSLILCTSFFPEREC